MPSRRGIHTQPLALTHKGNTFNVSLFTMHVAGGGGVHTIHAHSHIQGYKHKHKHTKPHTHRTHGYRHRHRHTQTRTHAQLFSCTVFVLACPSCSIIASKSSTTPGGHCSAVNLRRVAPAPAPLPPPTPPAPPPAAPLCKTSSRRCNKMPGACDVIQWDGMEWYGMGWERMVIVWHGMVWAWYGKVPHSTVWYRTRIVREWYAMRMLYDGMV